METRGTSKKYGRSERENPNNIPVYTDVSPCVQTMCLDGFTKKHRAACKYVHGNQTQS